MNENLISGELEGIALGDKRLNRRARGIVSSLSENPQASFAQAFSSESHREAFYRFIRNPNVEWSEVLEGHIRHSAQRACEQEEVLVIHDTTTFEFGAGAEREDLGWVSFSKKEHFKSQGFFGHFALAVSASGNRLPIGVVGFEPYRRLEPPRGKAKSIKDPTRESTRWGKMVQAVEDRLHSKTTPIHVMDREGDIYELFSQMYESGAHFVVRLCYDRRIDSEQFVSDSLNQTSWTCYRDVKLSARKKQKGSPQQKRFPQRKTRIAKLGFRAASVKLKRPEKVHWINKSLEVNIVHAFEIDPPDGVEPIEWKLVTSEPIETEAEILKIVDIYRTRWLVEEYFKALKTGCAYENRQLESYQTLLNALVLLIPIAWQLLLMRSLSREQAQRPAKEYFSPSELMILRKKADYKMPLEPTVKDGFLAVAALGGHIKNNGDPGWLVLMRGFSKLLTIEIGFHLAQERCDQ